jgi:hypothetical protein
MNCEQRSEWMTSANQQSKLTRCSQNPFEWAQIAAFESTLKQCVFGVPRCSHVTWLFLLLVSGKIQKFKPSPHDDAAVP